MKKKISILSLSLVTGIATVITVIIPLLVTVFPNNSMTSIESLVTISSLSALISILFNEKIIELIGIKKTILSGLLISGVMGVIPFFIDSFSLILVSRIFLGIGIGLYSPHAISLISLFFEGNERNTLLGMQMGIGALGNAVLLIISGWLAKISWQHTFLIYLVTLVIFSLILCFVPKVEYHKKGSVEVGKFNKNIINYLVLCFVTFIIIWGVQLKIPSYLVYREITSTAKAGMVLSLMNVAGVFAGFSYGYFYKKISLWLLPLGFLGAGVSVIGLLLSKSEWWILFWAVLFNFIYSYTGPTIVLKLNEAAKDSQLTKVNSFIMLSTILSSYVSPFIWNNISKLVVNENQLLVSLWLMGMTLLIISSGLFICIRKRKTGGIKNAY
ncbi:MFS transporter [Vagococcus fluvialis]|uniref:MFS transporter n=1 Tax=Vagococcus fluvialis TaxID=2738 RepID=UPI003D109705